MRKNVMGIELEILNAREAADCAASFLNRETVAILSLLRTGMFLEAEKNEGYRKLLKELNLGVAADPEILEALGENGDEKKRETDELSFLTPFLDRLKASDRTVAVLAESEEEKQETCEYLWGICPGLKIPGAFSLELSDDEDDAVNHLNGLDANVIVARLPIPRQEEFAFANRGKLNVSVWIGLGQDSSLGKRNENVPGMLEKLIEKRLFKRKLTRYLHGKE